ncbi:formylglycine-generating enzyme family protein [Paraglaciecola aquimarina]|uniref:Formylglycine-generating enzyme family protein n=1 Tax=Paraglaciecola algarum TaxID=3050085 RepID=A0ABS9D7X2_9ALTE|nr:SUMF1/EgtB/PvdO family nonheme iron enzyme [Paraglaciecola sp. G1-23]MCF2948482.1 formylglycine-generating enzyme family protein [Paraglaciecola sp. G1-23]
MNLNKRNTFLLGFIWTGLMLVGFSLAVQKVVAQENLGSHDSSESNFKPYTQNIKNQNFSIEMVPVKGGSFIIGSAKEDAKDPAETPAHKVKVNDFWMSKYEITWQQYDAFVFGEFGSEQFQATEKLAAMGIDAVTGATTPYVEMSFGMGKETHPAVNVTHYAAMQYSRWMTAKTGVFHRLPTEAEWEYACKKGQTDTLDDLSSVAWHSGNTQDKYAKVGQKAANSLGLHDMLGNVSEWVMDQYSKDFYANSPQDNPLNKPTKLYPRVVRGGSWKDDITRQNCTSRQGSTSKWKKRDPQIPKSNWWLTNAPFVGFRLVVPTQQPTPEQMQEYWLKAIKDFGR